MGTTSPPQLGPASPAHTSPRQIWKYMSMFADVWRHVARQIGKQVTHGPDKYGNLFRCTWQHAATCLSIDFRYFAWAMCRPGKVKHGVDKVEKSMAKHITMCRHMHWHTFPLLFWATCPRQVGEMYANACGGTLLCASP